MQKKKTVPTCEIFIMRKQINANMFGGHYVHNYTDID